jgi:hypothetical protein
MEKGCIKEEMQAAQHYGKGVLLAGVGKEKTNLIPGLFFAFPF